MSGLLTGGEDLRTRLPPLSSGGTVTWNLYLGCLVGRTQIKGVAWARRYHRKTGIHFVKVGPCLSKSASETMKIWQQSGNNPDLTRLIKRLFFVQTRRKNYCKRRIYKGADTGTRTRTGISPQRILSPLRLPFRHIGYCPCLPSSTQFTCEVSVLSRTTASAKFSQTQHGNLSGWSVRANAFARAEWRLAKVGLLTFSQVISRCGKGNSEPSQRDFSRPRVCPTWQSSVRTTRSKCQTFSGTKLARRSYLR